MDTFVYDMALTTECKSAGITLLWKPDLSSDQIWYRAENNESFSKIKEFHDHLISKGFDPTIVISHVDPECLYYAALYERYEWYTCLF